MRRLTVLLVALALAAPTTVAAAARGSDALRLRPLAVIGGRISPKSIVASQTGLFFAQNMMYAHTVTVYDRRLRLVKTIPDAVDLARLGYPQFPGTTLGAPVEAAFSPDARYAWVTNYAMYGRGFGPEGRDVCSPADGFSPSFVYRIDVARLRIDRTVRVGAVPKAVAVTPDGKRVLVSNWCSYDLSVIDAATGRELRRIPIGRYPRGIAVGPASGTAYVGVMGSFDVARVDLSTGKVGWIRGVGNAPRALALDPSGRFLYASLNGGGGVAKVDLRAGRVVARAATGGQPRSLVLAPDGRSLYVVNYASATVSKLRSSDLAVLQTLPTRPLPVGITYDAATRELWISCYSGSLLVFRDA